MYGGVLANEESLKDTYSEVVEVNKSVKSIVYYFLNEEYGEQLYAFKYKNNIFAVDKNGELYSYGEYSYSFSKDYFVIGISGSPSGGHNRNIFLFKEEKVNKTHLFNIGGVTRKFNDGYILALFEDKDMKSYISTKLGFMDTMGNLNQVGNLKIWNTMLYFEDY